MTIKYDHRVPESTDSQGTLFCVSMSHDGLFPVACSLGFQPTRWHNTVQTVLGGPVA